MASGLVPEFALLVTNLYAPSGTTMLFGNASPPLGWTTNATNDTMVRINSSTGGTGGGATGMNAGWRNQTLNLNAFTLSVAQLPVHNHPDSGHSHSGNVGSHSHDTGLGGGGFMIGTSPVSSTGGFTMQGFGSGSYFNTSETGNTGNTTPGLSINTGFANVTNAGSGATIQPNYTTPNILYLDHISATKS